MECDTRSRKTKMCKSLACGCKSVCSCEGTKSADDHENRPKRHPGTDYWTPNPCRPWISSWFDNPDKEKEHSSANRREKGSIRNEKQLGKEMIFPTQSRRMQYCDNGTIQNTPLLPPGHSVIGHPSLRIYRFRLPSHLLHLLDQIVNGCHDHAAKLPSGWMTYLYSLTKQDIALRDVPGMYEASRPIIHYIKRQIEKNYEVDIVRIDRNQPHVLKYSSEDCSKHTGVELHHDKCDLTANIMLSRSNAYTGGGTYFPDANATVKLEFGEFIIHPGNLVHGGVDITSGTRYLMILFTHTK